MKIAKKWFTLIEIIVAVAIFWIIMISMITIYIVSSDVSMKSDVNRAMQENMKNVVSIIWEDVMKSWIGWISNSADGCGDALWGWNVLSWLKMCLGNGDTYYLAKKVWDVMSISNIDDCKKLESQCFIVRKKFGEEKVEPITNNLVAVKDLEFKATSTFVNKVTLKIVLQPSTKSWVKANLIENSRIIFQTTMSERPF